MKNSVRKKRLALLAAAALTFTGCGGGAYEDINTNMAADDIYETSVNVKVVEVIFEIPPQPQTETKAKEEREPLAREKGPNPATGKLTKVNRPGLKGLKAFLLGADIPDGMERVGRVGPGAERLLDEVTTIYKGFPGVDPELVRLAVATGMLFTVQFDTRDYSLDKTSSELVKKNGLWLKAAPDAGVLIMGHTGEAGSKDFNLALGHRRGEAIKSFLTDMGVKKERIRLLSYGAEDPVDKNNNDDADLRNSRVEFKIIY